MATLTEWDSLSRDAVAIARARYEQRKPLIEKHANVLTNEERQFSAAPFTFPQTVQLSVDTFIRCRGEISDIGELLEQQILGIARQRFPDAGDDFVVEWD